MAHPVGVASWFGWRTVARWITAAFFTFAGITHFTDPAFFQSIVPPYLPAPAALVVISGFFEILGGLGMLVRPVRRVAGWGLIALLVAVFPANVFMAMHPDQIPGHHFSPWLLYLRLPLQPLLILWVWLIAAR